MSATELHGETLAPLLRKFWKWIVGMTGLSVTYTLVMTFAFKARFPYALPWFAGDPFVDFNIFQERFSHFRTPLFWNTFNYPFTYPAPTGVVFGFFYKLPHPLAAYFLFFFASLLLGAWLFIRGLVAVGLQRRTAIGFVATILVTSWPMAFMLNRANIEGVVVVALAAGVLASLRGRWWLGATLIGIAGAMKLFPLVMLALVLSKRRYKEFAWGLAVTLVLMLTSLEILGPNITTAQQEISEGLRYFEKIFAANLLTSWVGYDHSLFPLIKFVVVFGEGFLHHSIVTHQADGTHGHLVAAAFGSLKIWLRVYLALTALLGTLVYFLWIRKLPILNQLLALTICAVTLPPVSFDYTLLHLLVPFALLCIYVADNWRRDKQVEGLKLCLFCFAVIFTAGMYFTVVIRLAGQVRAVMLLTLFVAVCRYRFPWRELDEENSTKRTPADLVEAR